MKIGKYILHSSKYVRKMLATNLPQDYDKTTWMRLVQIYECRVLWICFYRDEYSFDRTIEKLEREITFRK